MAVGDRMFLGGCKILISIKSNQICPNFVLLLLKSNKIFPNLSSLPNKFFFARVCGCISTSYGTVPIPQQHANVLDWFAINIKNHVFCTFLNRSRQPGSPTFALNAFVVQISTLKRHATSQFASMKLVTDHVQYVTAIYMYLDSVVVFASKMDAVLATTKLYNVSK